jgi:beta-xylosidase
MTTQSGVGARSAPWNDVHAPAESRVEALIAAMSLREKLAQLYGVWVGASQEGGDVAPFQHELGGDVDLDELLPYGLGQLTRAFGSAPVDAGVGAVSLARTQRRIAAANRFGLPAVAHEECLAGFTTWGATAYPVPLAWGATFNPELIGQMAGRIGVSMRAVGVHQGLAPVLDVVRDPRWGRVEETLGEDPYLVGVLASAYVSGLEHSGVIATLKHFAGYSASRAGRNLAPVSIGSREFEDVVLLPFEMVLAETGVRSVMPAYVDVDGVPATANPQLLTKLLRERWGFAGTVVSDYYSIAFLKTVHNIAASFGEAGALALSAGVDVELPTVKAYGEELVAEVQDGKLDERLVDRALRRVLTQKLELGMLDPDWSPLPSGFTEADLQDAEAARGRVQLDTAADRALARQVAEESVVVAANDKILPLTAAAAAGKRILVTGPTADNAMSMLGGYSFPAHVGVMHPGTPLGIAIPTVLDGLKAEYPEAEIEYLQAVGVDDPSMSGIPAAITAASRADYVIACLGDRAGLFGRGTSGEGSDATSMKLPGAQQKLLEALLDAGTPVIVLLLEGRPYALGSAPARADAIVMSFFPGEEGAAAIAGVLSGRVAPAGRLPVSVPVGPGGQPWTYLAAPLAQRSDTSNVDPTPVYPFGHGLSYTTFEWSGLSVDGVPQAGDAVAAGADAPLASAPTDGVFELALTVRNSGAHAGVEVVQLYLHDPVASVVRPVSRLIGFAKLRLARGASARVKFTVPADLASFIGCDGQRIVEAGELELRLAASSADVRLRARVELTGATRILDHRRHLHCGVEIES